MDSGIYIRTNDGQNLLLEKMTVEQRDEWFEGLDKAAVVRTAHRLCVVLSNLEDCIPDEDDDDE